ERALFGGAAILEGGVAARDPGCAQVLPPWDDRAVSRPFPSKPRMGSEGAGPESSFFADLVPRGHAVHAVKKLTIGLLALLAALAFVASAAAHPLGNFTINRYSRIEPSGDRLYVLYVLDMAEIPTFQAKAEVDSKGEAVYGAELARSIARHVDVTVAG